MLAEHGEVFVPIPFSVLGIFQHFLCLDIERAPAAVKMIKDFERSNVLVCFEVIFKLQVVLLIKGIR
jgi:hypothetical protein